MSNAANPYAPPTARVDDSVGANAEAEAIRRAHISHEASIKSVGILYYLAGGMLILAAVLPLFAPRGDPLLAAFLVAMAVGQIFVGWGLRELRRWARIVGIVLSVLGLIGFPVGTLISIYILYLLLSKKGRTIFTPEYQDVIEATPHVKYKTSILVWIFLALLVGLVLLAIGLPFFAAKR